MPRGMEKLSPCPFFVHLGILKGLTNFHQALHLLSALGASVWLYGRLARPLVSRWCRTLLLHRLVLGREKLVEDQAPDRPVDEKREKRPDLEKEEKHERRYSEEQNEIDPVAQLPVDHPLERQDDHEEGDKHHANGLAHRFGVRWGAVRHVQGVEKHPREEGAEDNGAAHEGRQDDRKNCFSAGLHLFPLVCESTVGHNKIAHIVLFVNTLSGLEE